MATEHDTQSLYFLAVGPDGYTLICRANSEIVAQIPTKAGADFILKAVNFHEKLVDADVERECYTCKDHNASARDLPCSDNCYCTIDHRHWTPKQPDVAPKGVRFDKLEVGQWFLLTPSNQSMNAVRMKSTETRYRHCQTDDINGICRDQIVYPVTLTCKLEGGE